MHTPSTMAIGFVFALLCIISAASARAPATDALTVQGVVLADAGHPWPVGARLDGYTAPASGAVCATYSTTLRHTRLSAPFSMTIDAGDCDFLDGFAMLALVRIENEVIAIGDDHAVVAPMVVRTSPTLW